jgi:hypothetical protein
MVILWDLNMEIEVRVCGGEVEGGDGDYGDLQLTY